MKKYILIVGFYLVVVGCKSKDIGGIVGTWKIVAYKTSNQTDWVNISDNYGQNTTTFYDSGVMLSSDNYTSAFSGGWCNSAYKYKLLSNRIDLEFSKPGCIPLINPNLPNFATIVSLNNTELIIERAGLFRFIRQ